MKLPIGYRFHACAIISLLLALFWLWAYNPDFDNAQNVGFNDHLVPLTHFLMAAAYGYFLDGILKARVRKIPFLIYRVLYGCLLTITGVKAFSLFSLEVTESFSSQVWANLALPLGIAFLPPLFMYWRAYFMETPFFQRLYVGHGGSAAWAGVRTFRNRPAKLNQSLFSFPTTPDAGVTTDRIFLGRSSFLHDFFPRLIGVKPIMHFVLVAATRAGKSASFLYNVLLTYESDIIVIDPKGELAETTFCRRASKEFLKAQGIQYAGETYKNLEHGECYVLDPFGLTRFASSFYNPLSEVDIHDENAREMINAVCDGLVLPESDENRWAEEGARSFLSGLIAYSLSEMPSDRHNLSAVSDLLYGIDENGFASTERFNSLLLDMRTCNAAGGLPQQAAAEMDRLGDRQKGSVMDTVSRSLKWASDPKIKSHIAYSDFSFRDIGTKTVTDENGQEHSVTQTVYVCMPDTRMNGEMMRWLRLVTSVATVAMQRRKNMPKRDTLLILDEFAKMKALRTISEGYGLLAGYKIKLLIVLQNISDIQHNYKTKWNTMVSNAYVIVFGLAPHDTETPKWVSDSLGKKMLHRKERRRGIMGLLRPKVVSESARELLTPTEVATMLSPNSTKQIVLTPMNLPMLLDRLTFKTMKINDEFGSTKFGTFGLDGLRGHFYDMYKKIS